MGLGKIKSTRKLKIFGFSLTEVLAVAAVVASVPSGAYLQAKNRAKQTECYNNLSQVAQMLEMYKASNAHYPKAAFYPKDPLQDDDSIMVLLKERKQDKVPEKSVFMCPALPDELRKKGLTFIYNDELGGHVSVKNPTKTWVLIELSCVKRGAPAPHPEGFNVLFADGHVETTKYLPKKILTVRQETMMLELLDELKHHGFEWGCSHQHSSDDQG